MASEPPAPAAPARPRRLARFSLLAGGLGALVAIGFAIGLYVFMARGLPSASALHSYRSPLPTNLRLADGTPFHTFARQRRIYLPYNEIPKGVVEAFISAEDKNFFTHSGLDYFGILNAIVTDIRYYGSRRPIGASTITQQLAKNLLLTNELSIIRKVKEAILAKRIEDEFTKEQILELYLNEIFLGRNAYGIEAAALSYFGKPTAELSIEEAAFLAGLPKAPSTYNPSTNYEAAVTRRNYVLGKMADNGYITPALAAELKAKPLVTTTGTGGFTRTTHYGGYFIEEVRRQLIERFGETAEDGPHSVYGGGLWVRTTLVPELQKAAEKALRDGLMRYDVGKPWRGPSAEIDLGPNWARALRAVNLGTGYPDWRAAVVLEKAAAGLKLGFTDGTTGFLPNGNAMRARNGTPAWQQLRPGDVIPVTKSGGAYALRQIPEVSGAIVVEEPDTGRILALAGGFDVRGSSFNRATQALRQPGSAFKPFVYATGLDNGMTPATLVSDAPYCVFQSARLGKKCFRNFGGRYAGMQTMRWGLEQSRNLMTIRIAARSGMKNVVATAKNLGIGDYPAVLSIALGAGETTPIRLVNAYAMLVNGGKRVTPTLFDLVTDRDGNAIYRADSRTCETCNAADWNNAAMPRIRDGRAQAMNAQTAFQVIHMMEGVVQRGTATRLRSLDIPIAGKTGTTNGPRDVWFIGATPHFVAGIYIGFDKPRNLGGYMQGGSFAAPIWKSFYEGAFAKNLPAPDPFVAPPGIRMVRIDRRTGRRVYGAWPTGADPRAGIIWEAFKPESEPRRLYRPRDEATFTPAPTAPVRTDSDFLRREGGIY